jgi:glycosyltransferase involved in cell wall biosynthesis
VVLHVIQRLSQGGASRSLITMATHSARRGAFRHRIVSLIPATGSALEAASRAAVPVLDAPPTSVIEREVAQADLVQVHFWNTPELYELLHSELPAMRLLVRLNVGGAAPPHVLTDDLLAFADVVAVGSPHTLALPVCARLSPRRRRGKLAELLPAVDFERFRGLMPRPHAGFNVGYVGTVDFIKMHPGYVRMCASVRVPGVRFIVCGRGPAEATLARQAVRHGLADRLELRGYVEDVRHVLEELDVFGYPLCQDNYSSAEAVLYEAMFAGVPPVIFAHGGAQHTVRHGQTGLVVRDEEGYRQAIEHLYRHPEERARLGAAAQTFARRNWGATRSVRQLHRIYRRMLERPRRRRRWPSAPPATGATCFVASLGHTAGPFRVSLTSRDTGEQLEAERLIAAASPALASQGSGGLLHYRNRYRTDPHLRLWVALVLEQAGQHVRALAEYRSAVELGLEHPRLAWYQGRAAAGAGAATVATTHLRRAIRQAPEISEARRLLEGVEGSRDA